MISPAACSGTLCPRASNRALPARLWCLIHALLGGLSLLCTQPAAASGADWGADGADLANPPAEPAPPAAPLPPVAKLQAAKLIVDAEARTGLAWTTFSEDGVPLTDFISGCGELSLGLGSFADPYLKLGYQLSLGTRTVLGARHYHAQFGYAPPPARIEGTTLYLLPVGGYLELYPWSSTGISVAVRAGVGTFWPAEYFSGGRLEIAGAVAIDVGYDQLWSDSAAWGVRLRYGATGFRRFYIDEAYKTTQNSNELTLAARVSTF